MLLKSLRHLDEETLARYRRNTLIVAAILAFGSLLSVFNGNWHWLSGILILIVLGVATTSILSNLTREGSQHEDILFQEIERERARDVATFQDQYRQYLAKRDATPDWATFEEELTDDFPLLPHVIRPLLTGFQELYDERLNEEPPDPNENPSWFENWKPPHEAAPAFIAAANALAKHLPQKGDGLSFPVVLGDFAGINAVNDFTDALTSRLALQVFPALRRLDDNLQSMAGERTPSFDATLSETRRYEKALAEARQIDGPDAIKRRLKDTPFLPLFFQIVFVTVTNEMLFSHTQVVAKTGSGKTHLLQSFILALLRSPYKKTVIVVDSQGQMIPKINKLALLRDRPVFLIHPFDTPAINIFQLPDEMQNDPRAIERGINQATSTLKYMFEGFNIEMTGHQGLLFGWITQLMFTLPLAMGRPMNITDFQGLIALKPRADYLTAIKSLAGNPHFIYHNAARWFLNELEVKTYNDTKKQLGVRLDALLQNPTLGRLFSARRTSFDVFKAMNDGSVILIDTSADDLHEYVGMFGRFFISLIMQAVFRRASLSDDQMTHTFMFVDEAQQYFESATNDRIKRMLDEARKYKCGLTLAFHALSDAKSQALRDAIAATHTKIAGQVIPDDVKGIVANMGSTDPDFIKSMKKRYFALYIDDVTHRAVVYSPQPTGMEQEDAISEEEYQTFREKNRERIGAVSFEEPPPATVAPVVTPLPPEEDDNPT